MVDHERPDLQEQARSLVRALGEYTITLVSLEDNLLFRLANSQASMSHNFEGLGTGCGCCGSKGKVHAIRHCLTRLHAPAAAC